MKKNVVLIVVLILSVFLMNSVAAQEIKPDSKTETKTEPKQEVKPEAKVESKQEVKPEAKPEAKPETKAEPKQEVKPEAKPEVKPEAKVEPKQEVKPEAKPEAKPETKAEPKSMGPKAIHSPDARTGAAPQSAPASPPEAKSGSKQETKTPQQPAAGAPVKQEVKPEAQPAVKAGEGSDESDENDIEDNEKDEDEDCSILELEAKFDNMIQEAGAGPAFSAFFSKDAVVVSSSIIDGKTFAAAAESGRKIVLKPFTAKISSSCDYAFVVGDWEELKNGKVMWGGQYVNVWTKVKKEWKICVHAKNNLTRGYKAEKRPALKEITSGYEKEGYFSKGESVNDAEEDLFGALRRGGWAKAYDAFADEEIVKIRHNGPAIRGKKQVFLKSVVERGFLEGRIVKQKTAKNRDIAVVWGGAEAKGPQPYQKGSFLHIWSRDGEGAWKLSVDFLTLGGNEFKKSIL